MGQRARRAGITNAALRRSRRAQTARDEQAHQVAQAVYAEAIAWKSQGSGVNLAPLSVAASLAAPGVARGWGLPETMVPEVAAFLVSQFLGMIGDASLEGFTAWSEAMGRPDPSEE